jgi:hypothetical protein
MENKKTFKCNLCDYNTVKPSDWIKHVKEYQRKNGLTYKEAMMNEKESYNGGS